MKHGNPSRGRTVGVVVIVFQLSIAGAVQPLLSQDRCEDFERHTAATNAVVRKYAPMYWFSPGEVYLPTLPYFTAFDGKDNRWIGVRGVADFADAGEVAAQDPQGSSSWDLLNAAYFGAEGNQFDYAAIFYRAVHLSPREIDHLWRHLISDEHAWRRLRQSHLTGTLLEILRADTTQFLSLEYHAYYLRDVGLVGHYWDTEYTQMYVPADPKLADQFRVQIGAGHTEQVANNVLVLYGTLAAQENGVPPGVLVELGDHSTAPDVFPYGRFDPGLDVNWHVYTAWGVRDVQMTAGIGILGPYRKWMTFPRDEYRSTVLLPPSVTEDSLHSILNTIDSNSHSEVPHAVGNYSLLPADAFECLSAELEEDSLDIERIEYWVEIIQTYMAASRPSWRFSGFDGFRYSEKVEAAYAMKLWLEGMYSGETYVDPNTILIWRSKHSRSPPSAAFKQHLFRPVMGSLQRFSHYVDLFTVGLSWYPSKALMTQLGIEIPAFWLPARLPGYLELDLGVYLSCASVVNHCAERGSFAASLLHTGHYYTTFSWYGRVSFIPERKRVDIDPAAADWLIGGGLVITKPPLRIRIGLASDLQAKGPHLNTTTWEFIISKL